MSILITSFLISIVAALWVWVMVRRDPAGRPWLTGLCLTLLVVLPLLTLLPKWNIQLVSAVSTVEVASQGACWQWFVWGWAAGAVLMMVSVIRGRWILQQWVNESTPIGGEVWDGLMMQCGRMLDLKRLPELRMKSGLKSPVVAGLFYPVVLMPLGAEQWQESTRKMALLHELGHVKRRDLWLKLAADIACALHWYNPLVRWMRAKLSSQCEYACDAQVVASGADQRDYIHALCDVVELARGDFRPNGLVAMADHASLKSRVERLVSAQGYGRPWLAIFAAALTVSAALGMTLVRPSLKSSHSEPAPELYPMNEVELRHSANPFPGN